MNGIYEIFYIPDKIFFLEINKTNLRFLRKKWKN